MLNIPARIHHLLADSGNRSKLEQSLTSWGDWFSDRDQMWFFPDYTDHGLNHITRVFQLSDFLVAGELSDPDSTWSVLTESDCLVLSQSILLHDLAMHLDVTTFWEIVLGSNLCTPDLRKRGSGVDWPVRWNEFLQEACRWDDRIAKNVYGDLLMSQGSRPSFRVPPFEKSAQDKMDRLLVSEFLRRSHHDLALDMSIGAVPKPDGSPELFLSGALALISGLVARSHGSSIRDAVLDAEERFPDYARRVENVHLVYLMTLLRIADFLHLHAERAPQADNLAKRNSPISKREMRSHDAISDIHFDNHPDREAVFVEVTFDDSVLDRATTLINIRDNWLQGLRNELYDAWSSIGSTYSRYGDMSKLGLRVRRVQSNVWCSKFTSALPFYPEAAAFTCADSDFIKLLIRPLYGDKPKVGIRELIQNAVDAVRERTKLQSNLGSGDFLSPIHNEIEDADVVVSLCTRNSDLDSLKCSPGEWKHWVEIKDRGIGMTAETIRKYFLVAGATYRSSIIWKKMFVDEQGFSQILRSGRFGVGALAVFLLGDEIEVLTRHVNSDEGIRFTASLQDENIELTKCEIETPGTTIRVRASSRAYESLFKHSWNDRSWKWFRLAWPKVVRLRSEGGKEQFLDFDDDDEFEDAAEPAFLPAAMESPLPCQWRRLEVDGFEDVHWSFSRAPAIACNGIVVSENHERNDKLFDDHTSHQMSGSRLRLNNPNLSVFDRDGRLPLNLARDGLTGKLPFANQLKQHILRDLIAHSLVCGPATSLKGRLVPREIKNSHPAWGWNGYGKSPSWVYLKEGFVLADPHLIKNAQLERIIAYIRFENHREIPNWTPDGRTGVFAYNYPNDLEGNIGFRWLARSIRRDSRLNVYIASDSECPLAAFDEAAVRVLGPSELFSQIEELAGSKYQDCAGALHTFADERLTVVDSTDDLPSMNSEWECLIASLAKRKPLKIRSTGLITEWYIEQVKLENNVSPLVKLWNQIIGFPFIPYDPDERRQSLSHAFEELHNEVQSLERELAHRELRQEQEKQQRLQEMGNGGYPNFTHANQIRAYLRSKGVARRIRFWKCPDYMGIYDGPRYIAYVIYDRDDLKEINPETPDHGDPFVVKHDPKMFTELEKVRELLEGSNVSVELLGPELDEVEQ